MKLFDVQKIHEAGLITDEQRQKIIAHFGLKEEGSRFFVIISFIGAVLALAGIVLLVSANWDEIPRGVKIAFGLALMLGVHGTGWWLREVRGHYRKTGEALHFLGSGLFLANIALVGQVYHLVSRPPNALFLWLAGIVALPWILRSVAQHALVLVGFGIWFGMETNERDSLIYFGGNENQLLLYGLLGLIYLGFGYLLRRTRYASFAAVTETLGLLAALIFAYPLTWGIWGGHYAWQELAHPWVFPVLATVSLALLTAGVPSLKKLDQQWRWTWLLTLAGLVALFAGQLYLAPQRDLWWGHDWNAAGYHWIAAIGLFVFCLLQIHVGILERSRFMVNLGILFVALDIFATFLRLIGSMARTGTMFLISGVFLIAFSIYLEKKRRGLMQKINATNSAEEGNL